MKYYLEKLKEFERAAGALENGAKSVYISEAAKSAYADIINAFMRRCGKNALVVTENMYEARILKDDLDFYFGEGTAVVFPAKDYIFHNIETSAAQIVQARLGVIESVMSGNAKIIIAPSDAVMQYTIPRNMYEKYRITFRIGETVEQSSLSEKLTIMGYSRSDAVEGVGQFCIRGGILDVFPPSSKNPIRIEFFDDEVDTVRYFDAQSQLTISQVDICTVAPCREMIYEDTEKICEEIKQYPQTEWTESDIDKFKEEYYFPAADRYIPVIYKKISTIFEYIDDEYAVFLLSPDRLGDRAHAFEKEITGELVQFAENDALPIIKGDYVIPLKKALESLSAQCIVLSDFTADTQLVKPEMYFNFESRSVPSYAGNISLIVDDIVKWHDGSYAITVLAGSKPKAEAFYRILSDNGISAVMKNRFAENGEIIIAEGGINGGFEYKGISSVVISSREIFGTAKHRRKRTQEQGERIKSYADLSVGDYVVHQVHGIGKYLGMERIEIDGLMRDYLKIMYKDSDILYVPATSLDTVNKYIGSDAKQVKLNKMGGAEFARAKNKVRKSLEDIADRLIALYAERRNGTGYAFSKDTDWQKNFEEQFPYEETEDQLTCIAEMKRDMESGKAMDRLLCGDVGFGKTEVALRGAFKAVMDSKQVAYLVPTTILAQQHFNTFTNRMKDYPIKIEMLSRFCSKKEQTATVKRLLTGETDIVIGTHRLLQKDIKFKDLGLLIIDEEQRFGVKHKEVIKELKKNVDVLTLSATPIPRTLHMSLIGVRDMSVISRPPEDRYPVQTYVLEYDKETIRNAVLKELGRGGQVYYVFNRIDGIFEAANELQKMAPGARIAVGHGQMSERELESVMMATLNGEVDILVCTTIIETGLDIPNINTIIIENADKMGLSQLYQLRGRVGRSNRLAYAYLTYKKDKSINESALKRLTAIREFTEFGSGFKIAMRDLEIRGAGSLLGAAQHGEMENVGYDMYCRLLDAAVKKTKGIPEEKEIITTVDIKLDTYIPEEYIESHNIRIEIYKKIAAITSEKDKEAVIDELIDRFAAPPQSVINLIEISLIRVYASKCGITDVSERGSRILLYFDTSVSVPENKIAMLASEYKGKILYSRGERPYVVYLCEKIEKNVIISELKTILMRLSEKN